MSFEILYWESTLSHKNISSYQQDESFSLLNHRFPQVLITSTCDVTEVTDVSSRLVTTAPARWQSCVHSTSNHVSASVLAGGWNQTVSLEAIKICPVPVTAAPAFEVVGVAGLCPRSEEEVQHGHVAVSSQDRESNNDPHSHLQPVKSWQCTYMVLDCWNPTRGKGGNCT